MKFASSTGYVRVNWVGGGATLGRGFYNDQITYTLPASTINNYITIRSVDRNGISRGRMIRLGLDSSPFISSLTTLSGNKIEEIDASGNPIITFNTRNTPNLKYFHANFCSLSGNINDYLVDSVADYDVSLNMLSGDLNATTNKRYLYLNAVPINKIPLNIKDYQTISVTNTLTEQAYISGGDRLESCDFSNSYKLKSVTILNNPILTDISFNNLLTLAYYPWADYPTYEFLFGDWGPSPPRRGYYYFESLTSINVYDNPKLSVFILDNILVSSYSNTGYSVTISGCPALNYVSLANALDDSIGVKAIDSLSITKAAGRPPLPDDYDPDYYNVPTFICDKQPTLRTINISSLDFFESLTVTYCPFITSLRVNPTALINVDIKANSIKGSLNDVFTTSIPPSAIKSLYVDYNYFTSFTANSSLKVFTAAYNQFSNLNFTTSKTLEILDVNNNTKLSSLKFAPDHNNGSNYYSTFGAMAIDISNTRLSSFSLSANIVDSIKTYKSHLTSISIVTNMKNVNGSDIRTVPTTVTMGGVSYPPVFIPKLSSVFISGRFNYYAPINYNFSGDSMDLRQVTISSSNVMPVETSPYVNVNYTVNMDYALLNTKQSEFENFVFAFVAAPGGSIHTVYPQMNLSFN